jgi:hypothetical protein
MSSPASSAAEEARPVPSSEGNQEFERLREILLGDQVEQIQNLTRQISSSDVRVNRLAQDMPDALNRNALDHSALLRLAGALRTPVEEALHQSVSGDREKVAEILAPALSSALPRAMASFVAHLPGTIVRSALHLCGIGRERKAARSGLAGMIGQEEEHDFQVHRVCLFAKSDARIISVVDARESALAGPGPFFTEVQNVLRKRADGYADAPLPVPASTRKEHRGLIFLERSLCDVAAEYTGTAPSWLMDRLHDIADELDALVGGSLLEPENDQHHQAIETTMDKALIAYVPEDSPKSGYEPRLCGSLWKDAAVVAFTIFIVAAVSFITRATQRWNAAVAALDAEPGIVVVEKSWLPGRSITGLLDPLAPAPGELLATHGYAEGKVRLTFTPFVSDEEPYRSQRAALQIAERDAVQRDINRSYARSLAMMEATFAQMEQRSGTRLASDTNATAPAVQRDDLRLELVRTLLELPPAAQIELRNGVLAIPAGMEPSLKKRVREAVKSIPWVKQVIEADLPPPVKPATTGMLQHTFFDERSGAVVKETAVSLRK